MLEGGCHCGQVRYRVEGEPLRHGLCHCVDCRRASGAPVVAWMIFPRERVTATGELLTYASSEHGRRQSCARCGTGLFYLNDQIMAGLVDVQSATLYDPDAMHPPREQINMASRIGWMKTAHALPAHETFLPGP